MDTDAEVSTASWALIRRPPCSHHLRLAAGGGNLEPGRDPGIWDSEDGAPNVEVPVACVSRALPLSPSRHLSCTLLAFFSVVMPSYVVSKVYVIPPRPIEEKPP